MSKLPSLTGKEVITALGKAGFEMDKVLIKLINKTKDIKNLRNVGLNSYLCVSAPLRLGAKHNSLTIP